MGVRSTAISSTAIASLGLRAFGLGSVAADRGRNLTMFGAYSAAIQGLAANLWMPGLGLCVVVSAPDPEILVEAFYDAETSGPTPSPETFVVPVGVSELRFKLWGASGGAGKGYAPANTILSGGAAFVSGTLAVVEGDSITLEVGRGGGGASFNGNRVRRGLGGWPDGRNGKWFESHGCFGGGDGGSTRLYLNGVLMASAGGSKGTSGYPSGVSVQPATETYLHASVMVPVEAGGSGHVPGGVSNHIVEKRPGWGVLNTDPETEDYRDGTPGLAYLAYPAP